jgi:nitrite reductase/ring-hydroxylating ferredoxin subunit
MTEVRVPLDDLVHRGRLTAHVDDVRVLIALIDGQVVAYEDACGHRGNSLAEGVLRDCIVTCPAHLWRYDLRTGERHDSPGSRLMSFPLEIIGDDIIVNVPPPAPTLSIREALLAAAREEKA